MDKQKKIKVALIYDRPDWVLGEIALNVAEQLNHKSERLILNTYQTPGSYLQLFNIESKNDLIHFLSPWDYYRYYHAVSKPLVVTIHHLVTFDLFKQSIHRASAICTASLKWFDRLTKELGQSDDVYVTPPLVDCKIFKPIPNARENLIEKLNRDKNTILLGFAAKKSSDESGRKGLDRLYRLLSTLKDQNFSFLLLIFGKGWENEDFPEHLQPHIELVGYIEGGERPSYFGALDYYLCLSTIEGVPYPVVECMSSGVKVISTPVGIVPELISHEYNGFIVDEDNYLDTIPGILSEWKADSDRSRKLKAQARASVLEKFSLDASARPEFYEPVYQYALKDHPKHLISAKVITRSRLIGRVFRRVISAT